MVAKIKNLWGGFTSTIPILCIVASLAILTSGAVSSEHTIITLCGIVWLACLVGGLFDE